FRNGSIGNNLSENGDSISAAGDFNGDGIDDFIIGAGPANLPSVTPTSGAREGAGAAYVIYGSSTLGASGNLNVSDITASTGLRMLGGDRGERFGESVTGIGDFNLDGIDDIAIGSLLASRPGAGNAGEVWVVYGQENPTEGTLDFGSGGFGTRGGAIFQGGGRAPNGARSSENLGASVSGGTDLNGDGIADLSMGAPGSTVNGISASGRVYTVYGTEGGYSGLVALDELFANAETPPGFIVEGRRSGDRLGSRVDQGSDVNGDGLADLLASSDTAGVGGTNQLGLTAAIYGRAALDQGTTNQATLTVTVTGVNDAPTAVDDQVGTTEDAAIQIDPRLGDSDPDTGDVLSLQSIDTTGTLGSATIQGGVVQYDPGQAFQFLAAGAQTTDTFGYTITDGELTASATVTVTITGVNDAPVAVNDTAETDEDTPTSGNLLTNDTDAEDDTLTIVEVAGQSVTFGTPITLPSGALITLSDDGSFDYDPNGQFESLVEGAFATDSFSYTVSDGNLGTSTGQVAVRVNGRNEREPVSLFVNTAEDVVNDSDGQTSLREAINAINSGAATGDIRFDPGTFGLGPIEIDLTLGTLEITGDTSILANLDGNGLPNLVLDGLGAARVLSVEGASVTLDGVTLENGAASGAGTAGWGGGLFVGSGADVLMKNGSVEDSTGERGGGIANEGTLRLLNVDVAGNAGTGVALGGGLYNTGALTVVNSSVRDNDANAGGGFFAAGGTTKLYQVTFGDNEATGDGGAVALNGAGPSVDAEHVTVTGNSAGGVGGGMSVGVGTLTLTDSIVLGNFALEGGNRTGATNELFGTIDMPETSRNIVGLEGDPIGYTINGSEFAVRTADSIGEVFGFTATRNPDGAANTGDEFLGGVLSTNPGTLLRTVSLAPTFNNPALEAAGSNATDPVPSELALGIDVNNDGLLSTLPLATDARGAPREFDFGGFGDRDAGAVELQPVAATPQVFVVTTRDEEIDSAAPNSTVADMGGPNDLSLQEALFLANLNPDTQDTIRFGIDGTFELGRFAPEISFDDFTRVFGNSVRGDVIIDGDIDNDGVGDVTLQARNINGTALAVSSGNVRIDGVNFIGQETLLSSTGLLVGSSASVLVENSTFTRFGSGDGAIDNDGELTLRNVEVSGNRDGIDNEGSLRIEDSVIRDNAGFSSLDRLDFIVESSGDLVVVDSQILNNMDLPTIELFDDGTTVIENTRFEGNTGGAIVIRNGDLAVTEGTEFIGNSAERGAAISALGSIDGATVSVVDTTFQSNSATDRGGAIFNIRAEVAVEDSTFRQNAAGAEGGAYAGSIGARLFADNTLFEGNSSDGIGGAISQQRFDSGGGLLDIERSTITGNTAALDGGGIFSATTSISDAGFGGLLLDSSSVSNNIAGRDGGGVFVDGSVRAVNSSIAGNEATGSGGGVALIGQLSDGQTDRQRIEQSTILANTAGTAGALNVETGAALELLSSTVADNDATIDGGVRIAAGAAATLGNTILLANDGAAGNDDLTGTATLQGGNLIGLSTATNDDLSGQGVLTATSRAQVFGTATGVPGPDGRLLLPLATGADNPAIDAGDASLLPPDVLDIDLDDDTAEALPVDANGNSRLQDALPGGDVLDLGALEVPVVGGGTEAQIDGTDQAEVVRGNASDNIINSGLGADSVFGGLGFDTFRALPIQHNGDSLFDYEVGERIVFQGTTFGRENISIRFGSLILDIDTDGDAASDTTIRLVGYGPEDAGGLSVTNDGVDTTVQLLNTAPTVEDLALSGDEDTVVSGRLAGSDDEGDALSYRVLEGPLTGQLDFNDDGSFDFTPAADDDTGVSFTVELSDGQLVDTATVTIDLLPVNDAPRFTAPSYAFTVDADATPGTQVGTVAATDPEGEPITFALSSAFAGAFAVDANGVVTVAGPLTSSLNGTVSASDPAEGSTVPITITVNPIDPPAPMLFSDLSDVVDLGKIAPEEREFDALGGNDFVRMPNEGLGRAFDGGDGKDLLLGRKADDILLGSAGKDLLSGNRGDDTLDGGADADLLIGGRGNDIMTGGTGGDTFRLDLRDARRSDTENHDTITDLDFTEGDSLHLGRYATLFAEEGGERLTFSSFSFLRYERIDSADDLRVLMNLVTAHDDMSVSVTAGEAPADDRFVFDFGTDGKGRAFSLTLGGAAVQEIVADETDNLDLMLPNGDPGPQEVTGFFTEEDGTLLDIVSVFERFTRTKKDDGQIREFVFDAADEARLASQTDDPFV
ncbi:MAG: Ig-like domain-containing protein, partial [Pseudomonadota bacterium]